MTRHAKVIACVTSALLALACWAPGAAANERVAEALESARIATRRGDVAGAEALLDGIRLADATPHQRAFLELYRGNVDFMLHQLGEARAHFVAARDVFTSLEAATPGSVTHALDVTAKNVELADAELVRAERLAGRVGTLRTWILGLMTAAVLGVGVLARRARL